MSRARSRGAITATAAAPTSGVRARPCRVVCAPACTAIGARGCRRDERLRNPPAFVGGRRTPSPVVPHARSPSSPPLARNATSGATESVSVARPPSRSGVTAAAIAPWSDPSNPMLSAPVPWETREPRRRVMRRYLVVANQTLGGHTCCRSCGSSRGSRQRSTSSCRPRRPPIACGPSRRRARERRRRDRIGAVQGARRRGSDGRGG